MKKELMMKKKKKVKWHFRWLQNELSSIHELFTGTQTFTRAPGRYTEATLVKKLESEGIGRPSTYASTISTIQDRGYVEKKQKYLFPTSLARIVTEFLEKNFAQMIDYKFTANVEEEFDKVSRGEEQWQKMLENFLRTDFILR
jgi:DNA topoisomerase-1